jgi:hypothetical protein
VYLLESNGNYDSQELVSIREYDLCGEIVSGKFEMPPTVLQSKPMGAFLCLELTPGLGELQIYIYSVL